MAAVVDEKVDEEEKKPDADPDALFVYDKEADKILNNEKPWINDVRFFKKCQVNVVAATKMLKHAMKGVTEGKQKGGMSVEVMGLLVGRILYDSYIIMDVIELPVQGAENAVVAADEKVLVFMSRVAERVEALRESRVIGWYHSHPFDYNPRMTNCYFSNIDIQNQLSWQMMYKKFVGIVIDPLRSIARGTVEMGCFMAYPATYTPPANQCPDGTIEPNQDVRRKRWGFGADRYYALESSVFGGSVVLHSLHMMVRNHLWVRRLADCTYLEADELDGLPQRVKKVNQSLDTAQSSVKKPSEWHSDEAGDPKKSAPMHMSCMCSNRLADLFKACEIGQDIRSKLFFKND